MRNSFSVKTILRKDKCSKNDVNKHPLYYQIIFNKSKNKTQIPSGKYVNINQWDEKKRIVKDSLLKSILMKEESRIYKLLLEMENNDEIFTLEKVKDVIKGKNEEKINPDFYFHFDECLKNKFAIDDLADGTKEHYKLLKRRLISFKPRLTLNEIDSRFIDDFVYYLKVDLKTGNSGINSRIRDLNCVLKKLQNEKKYLIILVLIIRSLKKNQVSFF